jgi:Ca-activated chloride channel family protein
MLPAVRTASGFVILFLALVLPGLSAHAQTAIDDVHITPRAKPVDVATTAYATDPAASLGTGSLIRTSVNLVMVPVTITDERYRPVIGLDQENFQLFEGKKAQQIKHFSSEDAPVSVGIVVDTSGSMSYKLDRAREAVTQFCDTANPQDEFFLITFAEEPILATDFTNRPEQLENDLLTARSKGRTALIDAVYMAIQKMRNARYGRKALLILSDGGDNHSRYSEHDVKAAVKEADVLIYAVGTYDKYVSTQEELLGPELLQEMAELTGGHAFSLSNINEMPDVTKAIGTELRYQYMLTYQPQSPPHDGKWHKISVKLRLPRHLNIFAHIEARPGYYADHQ